MSGLWRWWPRWSREGASFPAWLMAGLCLFSAIVFVGPPLFLVSPVPLQPLTLWVAAVAVKRRGACGWSGRLSLRG